MLTIIYAIESLKSTFLPVEAATLQRSASAPTILTTRISREEQERLNEQLINAIGDRQNAPDAERVKALIRAGADVNAEEDGFTCLIRAAYFGRGNIVNALIEAGAEVNVVDRNGDTTLIHAVDSGNQNIVNALIKAGADVNAAGQNGETALIRVVFSGNQNIFILLIRAGADVNAADQGGCTPLIFAVQLEDENIVNALIEAGADVNAANERGTIPLTSALSSGHQNIITALQNAINERQAGRAYKEAIVQASTFAESARTLSGQSIPYGVNARVLERLRPEVVTVQFLIGGDFISDEELSRWNVQWDGRRGMSDEERQYIYDRVDPIRVMKHIEANTPADPT